MSKLRKFRRNPELFFRDSRHRIVRAVGSIGAGALRRDAVRALLADPVDALSRARVPVVSAAVRAAEARTAARRRSAIERAGNPEVTVIMAARNASATIGAAIDSIAGQSHPNWNLVVVDDASTDDTRAIAEDRAARDARIRVVAGDAQRGAAGARNLGLRGATGDYVTFQDADDTSRPDRLERQLAALVRHPSAVVCLCNCQRVDARGDVVAINGRRVSKAVVAMLFRRAPVLERLGYFAKLRVSEDAEYYERMRAVFGDGAEVYVFKTLYLQRYAPSSLLFSDGDTTAVGDGRVVHVRSAEAEAELARVRDEHRKIRAGEVSGYVDFE